MKFLILLLFFTLNAFAASGVNQNWSIAGNSTTSKNIVNGSFESGLTTGWTVSAGTLTATTSQAIQGVDSGLWSITGAGTIDLCATPTNLANSDLVASGWVKSTSTDLQVCSVINSVENGCAPIGSVTGWKKFQATGTYSSGNFCFRLKSVASGAITAYVDDVKIEPLEFPSAATITQSWQDGTEWTNFTPTGSWTTNTTYTGKWKRNKDSMEIQYLVATSGAPSGYLFLNLPSGFQIDTSKMVNTTADITFGSGEAFNGAAIYDIRSGYASPTSISVRTFLATSTYTTHSDVSPTVPFTFGAGNFVSVNVKVPIQGWSSTPTLLALPTSKDNNKTYDKSLVSVTGPGWTTTKAVFRPFRTISKVTGSPVWVLDFNIHGTTSSSVSTQTISIAGVTFSGTYQAMAASAGSVTSGYALNSSVTGGSSNISMGISVSSSSAWAVSGTAELSAKPTWADEWVEPGVFVGNVQPDWTYPLTVTGTNLTVGNAYGTVKKTGDGLYKLEFNIDGTLSSGATNVTWTISGVTFKFGQAISCNAAGTASVIGAVTPGTSTLSMYANTSTTYWQASGTVFLSAKPSWATQTP